MTIPIPRKLSDRVTFAWGVFWSSLVAGVLGYLWLVSLPTDRLVGAIVVVIGVFLTAFLTRPISRVDATLMMGVGPATLFLLLTSFEPTLALSMWGTGYGAGLLLRVRHIGDAAEGIAYLLGCALVAAATYHLLLPASTPSWLAGITVVAVYVLTRLAISSIRLAVVTSLKWTDAIRLLLPRRIAMFSLGLFLVAGVGDLLQQVISAGSPTSGARGATALTILFVGIVTFSLGMFYESRTLSTQLRGTLQAALKLPWDPNIPVEEQAVSFTERILPHYTIEVRPWEGRNINEITSPLGHGYLVARRSSNQPPFLGRDQEVLEAMTHIAETVSIVYRERDRLELAALTDELTGLPNYRGFRESLAGLDLPKAGQIAVAYVDVDGFKEINDTYGHEVGNTVLRTLAKRMRGSLRASDVVSRVGGDEFVLVLLNVSTEADARARIERLAADASTPVLVGERAIAVSLSHGVSFADSASADIANLVTIADARMYAGRGRGITEPDAADVTDADPAVAGKTEESELMGALTRAVQDCLITCAYQPIIDHREERVVGLEVLVRPGEPALKSVSADVLINEARRQGHLTPLSIHILETAVADLAGFQAIAPGLRVLHVNIDVEQVEDPRFLEALIRAQAGADVQIVLELGEGSLHRLSEGMNTELERLREEIGVWVALDDFGRSSSTLRAIIDAPLDVLKVDKVMIRQMHRDKPQAIIRSLAELCVELEVQMVVEGVEEEDTLDELVHAGVRYMQGYRFARPLSAGDLRERLTRHGLRADISGELVRAAE